MFKEIGEDKQAVDAYLNFARCSEESKEYSGAADGYAEAARLLPGKQWKTSLQYLKQAEIYYKMSGFEDRGFTLMKKFAADLCDSEDKESIEAGLSTYKELYPLLFEDDNMTMNFDMLEMYIK